MSFPRTRESIAQTYRHHNELDSRIRGNDKMIHPNSQTPNPTPQTLYPIPQTLPTMLPFRTFRQLLQYDPNWVDPRVIWKSMYPKEDGGLSDPEREDLIQIKENGINVISCKDIYYNIRTAMRMGLELARVGKKVVYLNSFARNHTIVNLGKEEYRKLDGVASEESEEHSAGRLDLRFMDVRTGTWGREAVEFNIGNCKLSPHDDEFADVLILNSFEFAAMEHRQKRIVVRDLVAMQEKFQMTVVVFTQEVKSEMEPGKLCRGPIGVLCTEAYTVSKVGWPKPREQKNSAESRKRAGNGTVHESPIDTQGENAVRQDEDHGDYWSDPWQGKSEASAAELAAFAKGPLLRQYMLDHVDDPEAVFAKGYQPTEWGLQERERFRIAMGNSGYATGQSPEVVMAGLNRLRDGGEMMRDE